jgi:P pilus assembly chaperone PapD
MASIIKIKRNNTGGATPSGGDLAAGELAVNTADGLLFTSSNGSDIVSLGQTSASIQEAAALANTNAYIASVQSDVDSNEAAELVRLSNTNAYIASVQSDVDANEATELAHLSNTNAYIAAVQSDVDANEATELAHLSNTNAYIADVKTDSASWDDGTDTITFTRGDSTTYSVALTGFPSDSVSNTYVQLLLSNTNAYIAAVQSDVDSNEAAELVRLSNTNAYIAAVQADVDANEAAELVRLSNTNAYIAAVQADVDQNEADADTAISNLIDGTTAFTGIDVNGGNIDGATIATSDVTVGSGKTLNVSAGTLTLADNQISGDKVDGGTISDFASTGIDDNATSTQITVADATTTIANDLSVSGALTVDGNLNVEGTVTYIGTTTVNVEDSMMKLSANNSGDAIDTGVYGKYVDSGTTKYAGYFRDATDETVKFFTGLEVEPTGTVNTAGAGYALATVEAVIDGGTF